MNFCQNSHAKNRCFMHKEILHLNFKSRKHDKLCSFKLMSKPCFVLNVRYLKYSIQPVTPSAILKQFIYFFASPPHFALQYWARHEYRLDRIPCITPDNSETQHYFRFSSYSPLKKSTLFFHSSILYRAFFNTLHGGHNFGVQEFRGV